MMRLNRLNLLKQIKHAYQFNRKTTRPWGTHFPVGAAISKKYGIFYQKRIMNMVNKISNIQNKLLHSKYKIMYTINVLQSCELHTMKFQCNCECVSF